MTEIEKKIETLRAMSLEGKYPPDPELFLLQVASALTKLTEPVTEGEVRDARDAAYKSRGEGDDFWVSHEDMDRALTFFLKGRQ